MFNLKSWKALSISATLIFMMLTSGIAGTVTKPVQADPWLFTLHAVLNNENPYYGWRAGYWDVIAALKTELAKIDINLVIDYVDYSTVTDLCWYSDPVPGAPPTGWDLTTGECWMFPCGLLWCGVRWGYGLDILPSVGGENIMAYANPKAVDIFSRSEGTLDPYKRKNLLWKWQEILMEDAAHVNLFYMSRPSVKAKCFSGHDTPGVYWNDPSHWKLDGTEQVAGTLRWAHEDTISYATSPMFLATYSQEFMNFLTFDTLYKVSRDPWPPEAALLDGSAYTYEGMTLDWPYRPIPELASAPPDYTDPSRPIVHLRDDVWWVWPGEGAASPTNSTYRLTADDVVWTFTAVLNADTGATGIWDFGPVIENVTKIDDFTVQFNLYAPMADFELLLANGWGGNILPAFVMQPILEGYGGDYSKLVDDATTSDPFLLPGTGPYCVDVFAGLGTETVELEPNPFYWGARDPSIDRVIEKVMPDPVARLNALKAKDIEISEALVATSGEIDDILATGYFNSYDLPRFATHPLYFNLKNQYLANRYVRLAIAHAIPYPTIFNTILPGWGCEAEPYFGTGAIFPSHTYTTAGVTVGLFNPGLTPYEYNLDKAREYLDLWKYSTQQPYASGPVGDADQSGLVDYDDWFIWREYNSPAPIATPIDQYPTWPFSVDPDFNNDGYVYLTDWGLWGPKYGTRYA